MNFAHDLWNLRLKISLRPAIPNPHPPPGKQPGALAFRIQRSQTHQQPITGGKILNHEKYPSIYSMHPEPQSGRQSLLNGKLVNRHQGLHSGWLMTNVNPINSTLEGSPTQRLNQFTITPLYHFTKPREIFLFFILCIPHRETDKQQTRKHHVIPCIPHITAAAK